MTNPSMFGEWIKWRRKTLDFTQEELAGRVGCSIFALRKIESGERKPSKQLATLLANALHISDHEVPVFVRVARGELNLERLGISHLEIHNSSNIKFPYTYDENITGTQYITRGFARGKIPMPPSPLLGRISELTALDKIFQDPQCRLLTLTGMGGIGKTHLAIEFARRQIEYFPGGVYFIPLGSIDSTESVIPAIADVVGCSFSGPGDLREQLGNYLILRFNIPTLLVLDNLEHLISQSQDIVDLISWFLDKIPQLKILSTSRERLNLHGEWMYELHGLPVPPKALIDRLDDYSAAVLFMQRAMQIKPGITFSDLEKNDLVRICQLVDGVPLAIELAAAWVGILTCGDIAKEIESNIDFLSTSMRDMPERHRSLKATFEHSWKLLSEEEQNVLSRLSVYRGGFDREAAEQVTDASLFLLGSLVSKSLVRCSNDRRYDLHEVIRQYAGSHLEQDQLRCTETRERHSRYYLERAAGYEKELKSASQQSAIREMTAELDNLRTAWDWGVRNGNFESLARSVRAFGWFYEVSGQLQDGLDQLKLVIELLSDSTGDPQEIRLLGSTLVQQGLLYFRTGQFVYAKDLYERSITILRSLDDKALLADALIFNGTITHLNGDYDKAEQLLNEGLQCARDANSIWLIAYAIYNLGHVESLRGDYQKGYCLMQEGLKIWQELGDPHSISLGLNFLVNTQIKLEKYQEARDSMLTSISLCEQTNNRWGMGTAYRYLGLATMASGQVLEAQGYFKKSLEIFGNYFEGWDIAQSLIYLGNATLLAGDIQSTEKIFMDGLQAARDAQSIPLMLDALAGLAKYKLCTGNIEFAGELSKIILDHDSSTHETREVAQIICGDAEKQLLQSPDSSNVRISVHQSLDEIVKDLIT